ncbi:vomeronasal type-2 receptor 116-like, partial [Sigmodon hispidus]
MACPNPNFLGLEQKKRFTLIFLFLLLNMPLYVASLIQPTCFWRMKQNENNYRELESCAFVVEAMESPLNISEFIQPFKKHLHSTVSVCLSALAFSVDEVNRNLNFLPNMSLAFGFLTSGCKFMSKTHEMIQSTVGNHYNAPNYNCLDITLCSVVISGPTWEKSLMVGIAMDLYHSQEIVQLTFGPFHHILNDQEQFPYLYQMSPKDTSLAVAMITLLLHFSWTWVGLAISDNDYGIQFLSYLRREMEENVVCFAFVNMIPVNMELYMPRAEVYYNQIMTSDTNVVIIYGDTDSTLGLSFHMWKSLGIQKIWVTTSQWDITESKRDITLDFSHRTLVFSHHHAEVSGFKNFLQSLSPLTTNEFLASLEWMNFNCEVSASKCKTLKNCSSNASLEWITAQTFDMAFRESSYDIYDAVYMFANELFLILFLLSVKVSIFHELCRWPTEKNGEFTYSLSLEIHCFCCMHFEKWNFRKKNYSTHSIGGRMNMNQNKELQAEYDIFQMWSFPNGLGYKVQIGLFSLYYSHAQQLHLYEDVIEWATGSRESTNDQSDSLLVDHYADCGPGFRKFRLEGMALCCFGCSPCPENEVSNETSSKVGYVGQCVKCQEDQYANAEKNQCIYKAMVFLTYEEPLGMALTLMVLCFTAFTFMVLGIFLKNHDTPIVKANNRTLSYILLISLIFCFLCPLLFFGHPNSSTCILQQITFGVLFTVAVSTVLAKTVTVLLAFKFTAPGRRMRYHLISRAPNYIIVICTLIQIVICAIWIGTSPPSIDIDSHSEHGQIIIVCDKGSAMAFYCVLGYHGSLAIGSFIVAFLARNLPDTFNETKLLTF